MGTIREQILIASTLPSGTIRELLGSPNTDAGGIGADDTTLYGEQKIVELLFMNEDMLGWGDQGGLRGSAVVGNVYIALMTDELTEASYPGYTRVPIIRGNPGWEFKDGGAKNIPVATWQPNDGPPVTITHFAITDSLIGGNAVFQRALATSVDIPTGDQVQFAYNQLGIKMN